MNAEGGSSNFAFATRASHSELWKAIRLLRGVRRPASDFFLRAESLFTAATYLEEVAYEDADPVRLTQSFLQARPRFLDQLFAD
jgi:predicted ATPase